MLRCKGFREQNMRLTGIPPPQAKSRKMAAQSIKVLGCFVGPLFIRLQKIIYSASEKNVYVRLISKAPNWWPPDEGNVETTTTQDRAERCS